FPCIFGVLPDRKSTTYQHWFKILKGLAVSMNRTFKPARVMSDYEAIIITAVAKEQFRVGVFFTSPKRFIGAYKV
ncbi:unnamed protein product, partial [Rotaria magnacalcarata]